MVSDCGVLPMLVSYHLGSHLAYLHILVQLEHRHHLCFAVTVWHVHFPVLPFGLAMAPWVFTKIMVVVVAHLCKQGVLVHPYLDDWLITQDVS